MIHRHIEIQVEKYKLYPLSCQHRILSCCTCSSALLSQIFSILNERIQLYVLHQLKKPWKYFYVVKPGRSRDMWYKAVEQRHSFELNVRNFVLWLTTNFYPSMLRRAVTNQLCPNHSGYIPIILYLPCVKCCSEVHSTCTPPRKGLGVHSITPSSSSGEDLCPCWRARAPGKFHNQPDHLHLILCLQLRAWNSDLALCNIYLSLSSVRVMFAQ